MQQRVFLDIGGQQFVAKGKVEKSEGLVCIICRNHEDDPSVKEAETGRKPERETLPSLHEKVNSVWYRRQRLYNLATLTTGKPYTDGTLIAAMKNASLLFTDPTLKKGPERECGTGDRGNPGEDHHHAGKQEVIVRQKKHSGRQTPVCPAD